MIKTSDIMKTDDLIYLEWLHNRLIDVYGENRNTDFVITLRRIINETEQKAVASEQKQPRAKKKALRLFGVVRSALYVITCTAIMILLDNNTELSQPLSWWLGWLMATIYTVWINKRK